MEVTKQAETVREVPVTRVVEVTREVRLPAVVPTPGLMPSIGFLSMTPRLVFGPRNGSIPLNPESAFIDDFESGTRLQDLIVEAEFQNPYPLERGDWSVGFLIRNARVNDFQAIIIDSDGSLTHKLRTGDADNTEQPFTLNTVLIDTSYPSSNLLTVIVDGVHGDVFINGDYAGYLDLSGLVVEGDVTIIGNYYEGYGVAGYSVPYSDFTIWSAYQQ